MGSFDNFSNVRTTQTADLNPAESFAGIMLATIAGNGYLAESEIQQLVATLYRMQLFQSYPRNRISRMLNKLTRITKVQNVDILLNVAVQCLPEYLHETAFAVTTDLVFSDGEVSEEEEHLLSKLSNCLLISQDKATKIIEVMIIKNKG